MRFLPLNNHVLDFFEGIGQTLCEVCNTHLNSGNANPFLEPTYDTCMEIRAKGTHFNDIEINAAMMFSHHYSISLTFAGNMYLYINDMYTHFFIRPVVSNTGCMTFVKFSNSITEYRYPTFSELPMYERGNFVSYIGSWKTWWEVEYFLCGTRARNCHRKQFRRTIRVGSIR